MEQFLSVPVDRIIQSETNPRKHFEEKEMQDLQESIKAKGVINPLLVRPIGVGECYEIVAGERRFRASKAVGLDSVPVIVRDLTNEQALEIQVIENLQRSDVHPIDEAAGYAQLMEKNHYDQQTIAEKVGKSIVYVYQRLQLLSLTESTKKLFWDGSITVTHAIQLARLTPEMQAKAEKWLTELTRYDRAPSAKRLAEFIQSDIFVQLSSAAWKKDDETLYPKAGPCTACPKRTGFNEALFDDVKKSDMCLDHKCFKKKKDLFIKRTFDDAKEAGLDLVPVSYVNWMSKPNGTLGHNDYEIVAKPKEGSKKKDIKKALIVDGPNAGKTVFIHQKREVEVTVPEKRDEEQKREKEKQAKRDLEEKCESMSRKRILEHVIDKVNTKLTDEDLKDICAKLYEECGLGMCDQLEFPELDEKPASKIRDTFLANRAILPKDPFQINKLLMRLALFAATESDGYWANDVTPINDAAARYKVDVDAIRAAVKKELGMEEQKPAAKKNVGKKSKKQAKG